MKQIDELLEHLTLERIEHNIFRGKSKFVGSPRVFGGQVMAQALYAAMQTVPEDRHVHSLHGYFLLAGDLNVPIIFDVDRIRDGGSFTTRRIVAIQKGKAIFNMAASFQLEQDGYDHQIPFPDVPPPEELATREGLVEKYQDNWPDYFKVLYQMARPLEYRPVETYDPFLPGKQPPFKNVWVRSKGSMPDELNQHKLILTYLSDYNLLSTAKLPHGDILTFKNTQIASLDHAMWFHREFRIDDWILYSIDSPSASGARGFTRGNFFTRDGKLIASTVQEGLMRPFKAKD